MEEALQILSEKISEAPAQIKELESQREKAYNDLVCKKNKKKEIEDEGIELTLQEEDLKLTLITFEKKLRYKLNVKKWRRTIIAGLAAMIIICLHSYIGITLAFLIAGVTSFTLGLPAIKIQVLNEENRLDTYISNFLYEHDSEYKKYKDEYIALQSRIQNLKNSENEIAAEISTSRDTMLQCDRQIREILQEVKQARTKCAIEYFEQFMSQSEMIPKDTLQEVDDAFVKYKI